MRIKYKGKVYEAVDDFATSLNKVANKARALAKLAEVALAKRRTSIEEAFVIYEERYADILKDIESAAKGASNELSRAARGYQKSQGIK